MTDTQRTDGRESARVVEIRERCERATPGFLVEIPAAEIDAIEIDTPINALGFEEEGLVAVFYNSADDADFFRNAREDIPFLLSKVERLEAENKWLRAKHLRAVQKRPWSIWRKRMDGTVVRRDQ